jgi:hypothetical protein
VDQNRSRNGLLHYKDNGVARHFNWIVRQVSISLLLYHRYHRHNLLQSIHSSWL